MIQMYVQPHDDLILITPKDAFNFTWEVMYFQNDRILVQLNWTHAEHISITDMNLDNFVFKVNQTWSYLFYSEDIKQELDTDWFNLSHPIPR